MSRIGRLPVNLPDGVSAVIDNNVLTVKSNKGSLTLDIPSVIKVNVNEKVINVERLNEEKHTRQLHGTTRANIHNMVVGVSDGFKKELIMKGTGYKAELAGKKLIMYVGYSHPINMDIPEGIKVEVGGNNNTSVTVSGINKQVVGQFSALIRGTRLPEPYKGKGVMYTTEHVRRKEGKKAGK